MPPEDTYIAHFGTSLKTGFKTRTVPCPVHFHAVRTPEAIAIRTEEQEWSYSGLDDLIASYAERMLRVGLRSGATVGIQPTDRVQAIVLVFAGIRIGVSTALLSTRLPSGSITTAYRDLCVDAIATEASAVGGDEPHFSEEKSARDSVLDSALDSSRNAETPELQNIRGEGIDGWRPATRLKTSGTTGEPRTAVHSVVNHLVSAMRSASRTPVSPEDRWLLSLPLYHVGGLAIPFRCFVAGASVVVAEREKSLGATMRRHHITHVSLVSTQLQRLLSELSETPVDLREMLVGGGQVPAPLIRSAVRKGFPIRTTYGLTEMSSQVATSEVWTTERTTYPAGRVLEGFDVRIDTDGVILVRGDGLFLGYQEGDGVTLPIDEEGWFPTGDMGKLTEDELAVSGRVDAMFISGGENIQPEEIEEALSSLPGVSRAVVVSVPDSEFGRRPVAFVDGSSNVAEMSTSELDAIREALAPILPRFKIPDVIYPWPVELNDSSIKPRRLEFQEHAERLSCRK